MSSCVVGSNSNEGRHKAGDASSRRHDDNAPKHLPPPPPSLTQKMPPPSESKNSSNEDIGAVVAKAKRAASSLWMILHAQSCSMGTKGCRLKGCSEAKFILLHLKTCPAGPGFDCPKGFRGCNQTRKLLAHYEKCRDIRNRQNCQMMKNGRKNPMAPQQHACLVCSFLARHARNHVLECRKISSTERRGSGGGKAKKVIISTFSIPDTDDKNTSKNSGAPPKAVPKANNDMMPPPPCRPPSTKTRSDSNESSIPSSSSDLTKIQNQAASLSLPLPHGPALGKSLDSSTIHSTRNHQQSFINKVSELQDVFKEENKSEDDECLSYCSIISHDDRPASFPHQRRRSESCNDAVSIPSVQSSQQRSPLHYSQSLPRNFNTDASCPNDPTLEFSLVSSKENEGNTEDVLGEEVQKPQTVSRRRSSSCGVLESLIRHPGGFDTITEEQEGHGAQTDHNDSLFSMDM